MNFFVIKFRFMLQTEVIEKFGNIVSVGGTFSWDFVIFSLKFRYCCPVSF